MQSGEELLSEGEGIVSRLPDPEELVVSTFRTLFPHGFERVLPVRKHRVRGRKWSTLVLLPNMDAQQRAGCAWRIC